MTTFTLAQWLQVLQWGSVIFAVVAAVLWFVSAIVKTPENYVITVVKPDMQPFGQPFGATYIGHGYSQELTDLGKALRWQSRVSGAAAVCAGIAAVLQAVAALL